MAAQISVFISYAREDSAFVDRLEADLQARNFSTWVDRRKLEGGQVWMDELEQAIDRCQVTLVVLSPKAVVSKFVRMEYRFAQSLNKLVIPLEYQACPRVPIDLNSLQWIVFKGSYEQGLNDLLIALNPIEMNTLPSSASPVQAAKTLSLTEETKEPELVLPQPAPPPPAPDLYALYRTGIVAKAEGDLERTAILWQQVLDRDPNFGNGILTTMMAQIQQELHPFRIQRLRDRAMKAQNAGEWRQAIGAWEALLGLEPTDEEAPAYRAIAEENQKFAWMYETALQFATEGQNQAAKIQLELLWQYAPGYGDPIDIAKKIGMKRPDSPQQVEGDYDGMLKQEGSDQFKESYTLNITSNKQRKVTAKFYQNFKLNADSYNCSGFITYEGKMILKGVDSKDKSITLEFEGSVTSDENIDAKLTINNDRTNKHIVYFWQGSRKLIEMA